MSTLTTSQLFEKLKLGELGIDSASSISYQLSYEELFEKEVNAPEGYQKGIETSFGAVSVDTGKFTGRSAKDKYVVKDNLSENTVWWEDQGSTNKPLSETAWAHLKTICLGQLSNKDIYVIDGYCGANEDTRISVRLVTEVAWQAHFFKNMFIRPTDEELESFEPDFTF